MGQFVIATRLGLCGEKRKAKEHRQGGSGRKASFQNLGHSKMLEEKGWGQLETAWVVQVFPVRY